MRYLVARNARGAGVGNGNDAVLSAALTSTGQVRDHNEDAVYAGQSLWAVADGMGGHAAGDVASAIVVEVCGEVDRPGGLAVPEVSQLAEVANARIVAYGEAHPEAAGLGTTFSGIAAVTVADLPHWAVFNVGDSRVYRWADGVLARATVDHSHVEELLLAGVVTEQQARHLSTRNVITRSLGTVPPPVVDVWVLPCTPGERFLICSDGLSNELSDAALAAIVNNAADPTDAVTWLVSEANQHGGHDNISAIVVATAGSVAESDDGPTVPRVELETPA